MKVKADMKVLKTPVKKNTLYYYLFSSIDNFFITTNKQKLRLN